MANTKHPLDIAINRTFPAIRRQVLTLVLADNVIDANERATLDALDALSSDVSGYRLREEAADSFKRNGPTSRVTRERFEDAGFHLVTTDDVRPRIIKFPTRRNELDAT